VFYDNANVRDLAAERRMQEFAAQTAAPRTFPARSKISTKRSRKSSAGSRAPIRPQLLSGDDKRDGKYHLITVKVKAPANTRVRRAPGISGEVTR
jgi:hypothetical protein